MDPYGHTLTLFEKHMISPSGKTVALVDHLWIGHHPMYFSQFTASFLRGGAKVIGLCPDPAAAMEDLRKAVNEETASTLAGRVHFHELPSGKRSMFNGRFEGDPVRTFLRWKNASDRLADAEAASGMAADMVFFPYLDSYLRFLPFAMIPGLALDRPWSGLYLRNHHHGETPSLKKALRLLAKGDEILRSSSCKGIGVLDERFIPEMEKLYRKPVVPFPDVTYSEVPPTPSALHLSIQEKAADRTIIGIIGLERRKGFLTLIRTAALAREKKLPFYFVCAGKIHLPEYSVEEREEIGELARSIASGEINNVHFDPAGARIPDELDYNSLFLTFDIAWAAYENFQGSSGTLSKAAAFEIPCIATEGECIGLRVKEYGLGINIPEGSPTDALLAISALAEGKDLDGEAITPDYLRYRGDHSQARLDKLLADFLASDC